MNVYDNKVVCITVFSAILFTTSELRADDQLPASNAFAEGTKEFLSDPARTGSLLGSILAGAAVANPLAPLLGSVAGFVIGKSSAFSKKRSDSTKRNLYSNRSLIPKDGTQLTDLAGVTGEQATAANDAVVLSFSNKLTGSKEAVKLQPTLSLEERPNPQAGHDTVRSEQILFVEPSEKVTVNARSIQTQPLLPDEPTGVTTTRSTLQKQLAHTCSNTQTVRPVGMTCYYYSQ